MFEHAYFQAGCLALIYFNDSHDYVAYIRFILLKLTLPHLSEGFVATGSFPYLFKQVALGMNLWLAGG